MKSFISGVTIGLLLVVWMNVAWLNKSLEGVRALGDAWTGECDTME